MDRSDAEKQALRTMVNQIKSGRDVWVEEYEYETAAMSYAKRMSYDAYCDLATEAQAIAYRMRNALEHGRHAQVAAELAANDTSALVPPRVLTKVSKWLSRILPEPDLEFYNAALREKKSGPLTYEAIAFVAAVHRDSCKHNISEQEEASASPFSRISKAAKEFGPAPLDNRQIRFALTCLETLGFTTETRKAVYNYHDKKTNQCGFWKLENTTVWEPFFA